MRKIDLIRKRLEATFDPQELEVALVLENC